MLANPNRGLEIIVQEFPQSDGQRLLEAGYLCSLREADLWDQLRLGLVATSLVVGESRQTRCCALCGGAQFGLAHLLGIASRSQATILF